MPVMLPSVSMTEANRILQAQDAIITSVPEVEQVLGKVGKAETSTDPAPVSMIESIVLLKPKNQWRPGKTKDDIVAELDAKLSIPGVRNGWTQPIINRINMLSTGVRTDLGIKIFGKDLDTLERLAIGAEQILRGVRGSADLYAERTQGGFFLDITVDREAVARYGVSTGDVQDLIETAIGGQNLGVVIEGRQRFPIRVRYEREWRDNIEAMKNLLVPVDVSQPNGAGAATASRAGSDSCPPVRAGSARSRRSSVPPTRPGRPWRSPGVRRGSPRRHPRNERRNGRSAVPRLLPNVCSARTAGKIRDCSRTADDLKRKCPASVNRFSQCARSRYGKLCR